MNRFLRHDLLSVAVVILWGLLSIASCDSSSRRAAMLAVLDEADSLNRSYIPITTDSLLREAVDYFDSHGTPNERQVSNLRKDVNTALFNEKTTRTLYQNLSRHYKILSS